MPWLTAQLLQDPEQPETGLLDEYYRRYFKEAAEPMRRFFESCEAHWMGQPGPAYWLKHFRNESQAVVFPSPVCRELRDVLNEAAQRASSEMVRERVRLVSEAFGVTERLVIFKEAKDRAINLTLNEPVDWRRLASALHEYLSARREFIRYTGGLKRDEPLAIAPFGWDDYLKNEPISDALLAINASATGAGEQQLSDAEVASWNEPLVTPLWPAIRKGGWVEQRSLARSGELAGDLQPARRIGGFGLRHLAPRRVGEQGGTGAVSPRRGDGERRAEGAANLGEQGRLRLAMGSGSGRRTLSRRHRGAGPRVARNDREPHVCVARRARTAPRIQSAAATRWRLAEMGHAATSRIAADRSEVGGAGIACPKSKSRATGSRRGTFP